ncbi:MAG: CarD family transcriptional regulator [Clostridiales Family XIII bacterium]|jgi:CarD family transcriptional regulator|nr:CarD family transcriptional regulator [Clostridiales Family XIII bacterium]
MFAIGEKIVYPMHGAGTIEAIEERNLMGEKCKYYVLLIPQNEIRIMIPCNKTETVGVRGVIPKSEVDHVSETLKGASTEMAKIWNRRYRDNMEKLKTGTITHVAEVVRDLMRVDREKRLSTGEKKMLSNAKQILISELVLVSGKCAAELDVLIEQSVMS